MEKDNLLKFKNDKRKNKGCTIRNKSVSTAEIIIYNEIGRSDWFEDRLSAKEFDKILKEIPDTVNTLEVRINSLGGDVFDGVAIYSRLKHHKAKVKVYIDGIAASIASIIAMAGDEIYMNEGSIMMIHKPWTVAWGNSKDFEDIIDRLNDVEDRLVNIYAKKAQGLDRDEIKQMLAEETYMGAEEAIDKGFATELMDEEAMPISASLENIPWIKKNPQLKTQGDVNKTKALELKKRIEGKLARK